MHWSQDAGACEQLRAGLALIPVSSGLQTSAALTNRYICRLHHGTLSAHDRARKHIMFHAMWYHVHQFQRPWGTFLSNWKPDFATHEPHASFAYLAWPRWILLFKRTTSQGCEFRKSNYCPTFVRELFVLPKAALEGAAFMRFCSVWILVPAPEKLTPPGTEFCFLFVSFCRLWP